MVVLCESKAVDCTSALRLLLPSSYNYLPPSLDLLEPQNSWMLETVGALSDRYTTHSASDRDCCIHYCLLLSACMCMCNAASRISSCCCCCCCRCICICFTQRAKHCTSSCSVGQPASQPLQLPSGRYILPADVLHLSPCQLGILANQPTGQDQTEFHVPHCGISSTTAGRTRTKTRTRVWSSGIVEANSRG